MGRTESSLVFLGGVFNITKLLWKFLPKFLSFRRQCHSVHGRITRELETYNNNNNEVNKINKYIYILFGIGFF